MSKNNWGLLTRIGVTVGRDSGRGSRRRKKRDNKLGMGWKRETMRWWFDSYWDCDGASDGQRATRTERGERDQPEGSRGWIELIGSVSVPVLPYSTMYYYYWHYRILFERYQSFYFFSFFLLISWYPVRSIDLRSAIRRYYVSCSTVTTHTYYLHYYAFVRTIKPRILEYTLPVQSTTALDDIPKQKVWNCPDALSSMHLWQAKSLPPVPGSSA